MKHEAETERIHIKVHVEGSAVEDSGCAEALTFLRKGVLVF